MSRTPLWRKALPEPAAGKSNLRIYVKHGYGADVLEEVVELRDISRDAAKEIVGRARQEGGAGEAALAAPDGEVVHILRAGVSFCRMRGVPRDWPKGHLWVPHEKKDKATCPKCIEVANAVDKRT